MLRRFAVNEQSLSELLALKRDFERRQSESGKLLSLETRIDTERSEAI